MNHPSRPTDRFGRPTHGDDGAPITDAVRNEVARLQAPTKIGLRMDELEGDVNLLNDPSGVDTPPGWVLKDDVTITARTLELWGHTPGRNQIRKRPLDKDDPFLGVEQSIVGHGLWEEHRLSLQFRIPTQVVIVPKGGHPVPITFDQAYQDANQVAFQRHLKVTTDGTTYVLDGRQAPVKRAPEAVLAPNWDSIQDVINERIRVPVTANKAFDPLLLRDIANMMGNSRNRIVGYTKSLSKSLGDFAGVFALWWDFAYGGQMSYETAYEASGGMIRKYDHVRATKTTPDDRPAP